MEPAGRRRGRTTYRPVTYGALDDDADRRAGLLRRAGLCSGARVVLMAPPSAAFFATTFALFRAGAVPVFIDPGVGVTHMRACLARVSAHGFIGTRKALWARRILASRETREALPLAIDDLKSARGRAPGARAPDAAAILFTSGSTGAPKGAIYTHANFHAQIEALRAAFGIAPGEVDLCTFPLFALFAPALGLTAVIPEMDFTRPAAVDPARLTRALHDFSCRNLFGSPALLDTLARYGAVTGERLPSLKRVISAGAPVPARVVRAMTPLLSDDAELHTPYGATEALPLATIGSREILSDTIAGAAGGRGVCVGRAAPGARLRLDADGEILAAGPQVTASYFGDASATAAHKVRDADGVLWHRTGDLGAFDAKGRLWFHGRKSHSVTTAQGVLLSVPCEGVFNAHPAVKRAALVGRGQASTMRPVICVETFGRLSRGARRALADELLALCAPATGTAAITEIHFVASMPVDRRHNAKIDRLALGKRLGP